MNDEFEKWFLSISREELNSRSVHENMLHAWQMSRALLPTNATLRTRLAAAESALAPFARLADWFPANVPDETRSIYDSPDGYIITIGDLRRAAALLAQPAAASE